MIRVILAITVFAVTSPGMAFANGGSLPPMPDWQTDAANCAWHWKEGGGIGLWAETCRFNGATWHVVWDEDKAAFVTRNDDSDMGIAVQAFALPGGAGITALSEALIETGSLDANAECVWQPVAPRPAPRTTAFRVLTPVNAAALTPTPLGDVPEPVCGPYGASTHGIRYFMTDLRWPGRAIFVEEGQERPLFDPASITPLP
jgi:hypothetical protein